MKPRERVEMALNHEEPDRCPFQASFTPEFAARLQQELGLEKDLHNSVWVSLKQGPSKPRG